MGPILYTADQLAAIYTRYRVYAPPNDRGKVQCYTTFGRWHCTVYDVWQHYELLPDHRRRTDSVWRSYSVDDSLSEYGTTGPRYRPVVP